MKYTILLAEMNVKEVIDQGSGNSKALDGVIEQVDEFGGGGYNLLYKFGIYAVVIAFMIGGIALIFSNPGNRGEHKSNILWKVIGGVLIFAAVSIVGFLQTIGQGLF